MRRSRRLSRGSVVDLTARLLNYVSPGQGLGVDPDEDVETLDPPVRQLQKQTRLKSDEVTKLIAAYLDGITIRSLARQYQVNESTVHAHLNRHQVPRRPYRALTPAQLEEARRLYNEGWSANRLAQHFGVAHRTVRRVFQAAR